MASRKKSQRVSPSERKRRRPKRSRFPPKGGSAISFKDRFSNKKGVIKIPETDIEGCTVLPNREDGTTGLQIILLAGKKPTKPLKGGSLISVGLLGNEYPAIVLTYSPPGIQTEYTERIDMPNREAKVGATIIATLLESN